MPMKCSHSARTDVGRHREHNEDDYGVGEGTHVAERGHLFVVCDGMGGHEAGEVASRIVVESILSAFYAETGEDRGEALSVALDYANTNIFNEGHQSSISMGTTGVAAVIHRDECIIANVGDSRAYLIRKGAIRQISRDHTLVNEQIAAGMITSADAEKMLYKHVITRTLGHQPDVIVDTFRLVDMANERGGNDNITVLMVRVDAVDGTSPLPIPVDAMPIVTGQYNPLRIQSSQSTASMRLMLAPQISWQGAGLAVVLLIILLTIIVLGLWGIWPFAPM